MLSVKRPLAGAIWQRFKDNIEKPIAVILVINTAAHTIGATFAGAQFELLFGDEWLLLFSLALTYFMLQFTEILPKTLGVRYNHALAPLVARPLDLMVSVMRPVLWLVRMVNKPFERSGVRADTTLEEIAGLAASARLKQHIDPRQVDIIHAVAQLESLRLRQVMTPRVDVTFLRVGQPLDEVLDVIQQFEYTRLPLCERDLDHPIGFVHVKDVFRQLNVRPARGAESAPDAVVKGEGRLDLLRIKRDVVVLQEQFSLTQALAHFQRAGIHMGIVVDEFGQTLGIATLEDVIEEIVGEIRDEFDEAAPKPIKKEGSGYRVKGRVALYELVHAIPDIGVDYTESDVDTVGGYIAQALKHLPAKGETTNVGPYRWTVSAADPRRVREVLIEPLSNVTSDDGT
jgi:CBS domain containing-hemolysin-like protein